MFRICWYLLWWKKGLIHRAIMLSGGGHILHNPTSEENSRTIWRDFLAHMGVSSVEELKAVPVRELYVEWMRSLGIASGANLPCLNGISLTDHVSAHLERNTVQDVPVIMGVLSEDCFLMNLFTAARNYAAARSLGGGQPVYLFFFDRCQPGDTTFGAFHAADLYYAFGDEEPSMIYPDEERIHYNAEHKPNFPYWKDN